MEHVLDNNTAANQICNILRREGKMDLGQLGSKIKFVVIKGGLLNFLESYPEKFKLTRPNPSITFVELIEASSSHPKQTTTFLTPKVMKELQKVIANSPGMSWQEFIRLHPTLSTAIESEARQLGFLGPFDLLSKWPHMFSIQNVHGKRLIFPAASPSTAVNNNNNIPSNTAPISDNNNVPKSIEESFQKLSVSDAPPLVSKVKKLPIVIVDSMTALCDATTHLLSDQEQLAVDCEGVNLGKMGPVTLVQVASPSRIYLFDMMAKSEVNSQIVSFLKDLMESNCFKVFHDCRRDSEALYFQHNIQLKNVMDTQVLYGIHLRILGALNPLEADTKRVGLNRLLEKFNLKINSHKKAVGHEMDKNPRYWETRPLTTSMIEYAAEDVSQLIDLADSIHKETVREFTQASVELSLRHSRIFTTDQNTGYLQAAAIPQDVPLSLHFNNGKAIFSQVLETDDELAQKQPSSPQKDPNFLSILKALPQGVADSLRALLAKSGKSVNELVIDQYRSPIIRYNDDTEDEINKAVDMAMVLKSLYQFKGASEGQDIFTTDNRTGIPGSLHRISAIRDKNGKITGLTYRVGRHVEGVASLIQDIIQSLHTDAKAKSLLVLGPPGVGKTTLLRDITKMLADELRKRVIVVDTSNEIGGDCEPPHPCIGRARRMQVPHREQQHEVLIEVPMKLWQANSQAVQNHNPQVIIIDEIGTPKEVDAARTISQRGVTLVGTAHGVSLSTLLKNPQLRALVGGVQQVILNASEAEKRAANNPSSENKKSVLERAGAPTFEILIEVRSHRHWRLYTDVGRTVDEMLAGKTPTLQERWQDVTGNMFARLSKLKTEESSNWLDGLFSLAN